jgi:hypothetical protein
MLLPVLAALAGFAPPTAYAREGPMTRLPPPRAMADVVVKFPRGCVATVEEGAPLSLAAYQAGAQVTYQCKAGVCASCEVMMGFMPVKTCQTTVRKPLFGNTISVNSKPGSATKL